MKHIIFLILSLSITNISFADLSSVSSERRNDLVKIILESEAYATLSYGKLNKLGVLEESIPELMEEYPNISLSEASNFLKFALIEQTYIHKAPPAFRDIGGPPGRAFLLATGKLYKEYMFDNGNSKTGRFTQDKFLDTCSSLNVDPKFREIAYRLAREYSEIMMLGEKVIDSSSKKSLQARGKKYFSYQDLPANVIDKSMFCTLLVI